MATAEDLSLCVSPESKGLVSHIEGYTITPHTGFFKLDSVGMCLLIYDLISFDLVSCRNIHNNQLTALPEGVLSATTQLWQL